MLVFQVDPSPRLASPGQQQEYCCPEVFKLEVCQEAHLHFGFYLALLCQPVGEQGGCRLAEQPGDHLVRFQAPGCHKTVTPEAQVQHIRSHSRRQPLQEEGEGRLADPAALSHITSTEHWYLQNSLGSTGTSKTPWGPPKAPPHESESSLRLLLCIYNVVCNPPMRGLVPTQTSPETPEMIQHHSAKTF